jgi:hypothetical protein
MTPSLALAGLGGLSSADDLLFDCVAMFCMLVQALFLPIFTFDHPPRWVVLLQPVIVISGLIGIHAWLRRSNLRPFRRALIYTASFCLLMFVTNMAGEARDVLSLAGDIFQKARLIASGLGHPADARP